MDDDGKASDDVALNDDDQEGKEEGARETGRKKVGFVGR